MAEDQRVEGPSSICKPAVVAPVLLVEARDNLVRGAVCTEYGAT